MTKQNDWPLVHAERAALAADLAPLTEQQWRTPSLGAGLSVREVLAHLTAAASLTPLRWFAGVLRCRFDFDRQVVMRLAEHLGGTGAETLDRFRAVVGSTTKPPLPVLAMLGEAVVHGEDIRRPLGLRREYPPAVLDRVAGYFAGSDLTVPAKGRIAGLRLAATDGPFHTGEGGGSGRSGPPAGTGALVSGPTLALVMAMTGRAAYLDELTGPGVPTLRSRCDHQPDGREG